MNCFSILSTLFGSKGEGASCDISGGEDGCPCVKCLCLVKDKFDVDVTENDKGICINISPKDRSKVEALKSLLRGIKGLCCEWCTEEESESGETDKECCPE